MKNRTTPTTTTKTRMHSLRLQNLVRSNKNLINPNANDDN